jgi:hypothetical protein
LVSQKTFFVCVENGDQRYFGQVQAFTKQVYAYQNIKHTQTQFPQNFNAVERGNFRMYVPAFDTHSLHVLGKFLGHTLC